MRKELAEVKLPEKFTLLEAMMWNPSGYCVGSAITLADLFVYALLNWLGMGVLDGVPPSVVLDFPKLKNLVEMLNADPRIASWNKAKNPKLPWF